MGRVPIFAIGALKSGILAVFVTIFAVCVVDVGGVSGLSLEG